MRDDSGLGWAEPGVHNGNETILSNGNAMISPVSPLSCSICARPVTESLPFLVSGRWGSQHLASISKTISTFSDDVHILKTLSTMVDH
jgi:hypothetical protein